MLGASCSGARRSRALLVLLLLVLLPPPPPLLLGSARFFSARFPWTPRRFQTLLRAQVLPGEASSALTGVVEEGKGSVPEREAGALTEVPRDALRAPRSSVCLGHLPRSCRLAPNCPPGRRRRRRVTLRRTGFSALDVRRGWGAGRAGSGPGPSPHPCRGGRDPLGGRFAPVDPGLPLFLWPRRGESRSPRCPDLPINF